MFLNKILCKNRFDFDFYWKSQFFLPQFWVLSFQYKVWLLHLFFAHASVSISFGYENSLTSKDEVPFQSWDIAHAFIFTVERITNKRSKAKVAIVFVISHIHHIYHQSKGHTCTFWGQSFTYFLTINCRQHGRPFLTIKACYKKNWVNTAISHNKCGHLTHWAWF